MFAIILTTPEGEKGYHAFDLRGEEFIYSFTTKEKALAEIESWKPIYAESVASYEIVVHPNA